jgi:hypothetical protein
VAKKRIYANIEKVEAQEDGTLKVWGFASSGAEDSDGETITPEAMKAALPDYMKFGAVREMHQSMAAGTAIEASVDDTTGKTMFGAHVVDPVAVLKVQTQVYKGFSIGGKVTERDPLNKKIIKGLNLVEVSLVDRPANPDAVFTMYKAASTPEDDVVELAELLDAGTVTPAQVLELIKASKPAEQLVPSEAPPQGGVPSTEPVPAEIVKGMYSVADFASVLNSVSYLASEAGWEAQYEGDNSPLPASLFKWLQDGIEIFKGMVAEETAEMVASLRVAANLPEVITLSDSVADKVAKAGARFSKATKEALGKIHGACKEASEHLDGLKYADDTAEDKEAAAPIDDLTKAAADTIGIAPDNDDVHKAIASAIAPLNEALEKARKESDDLKATVAELSKRAAPGKALLKAVALTKGQDALPDPTAEPVAALPPEGTPQRAEAEMKKVFAQGGRRLS